MIKKTLQVTSADHTGKQDVVPIQVRKFEAGGSEVGFEFRKQRFVWDYESNCFHKLRSPTKVRLH